MKYFGLSCIWIEVIWSLCKMFYSKNMRFTGSVTRGKTRPAAAPGLVIIVDEVHYEWPSCLKVVVVLRAPWFFLPSK